MLCANQYFQYKNGKLGQNYDIPVDIFGHLEIINTPKNQFIEINGMYKAATKIPFAFVLTFSNSYSKGDNLVITGKCKMGAWDTKMINLAGKHVLEVENGLASLKATCYDSDAKIEYRIQLNATSTKCLVYQPKDAAERATFLINEKKEHFKNVHVLNFAYYDYPFLEVFKNCRYYINKFGEEAPNAKPGYAIVGKNGLHCGVVDAEGDKFIHTDPVKKVVTLTPLTLAKNYFKSGYIFKTVPCNGPHD